MVRLYLLPEETCDLEVSFVHRRDAVGQWFAFL